MYVYVLCFGLMSNSNKSHNLKIFMCVRVCEIGDGRLGVVVISKWDHCVVWHGRARLPGLFFWPRAAFKN